MTDAIPLPIEKDVQLSDIQKVFDSYVEKSAKDYQMYIRESFQRNATTPQRLAPVTQTFVKDSDVLPPMSPTTVHKVEHALLIPEHENSNPLGGANGEDSGILQSSSVLAIDVDLHEVNAPPDLNDTPEDSPTVGSKERNNQLTQNNDDNTQQSTEPKVEKKKKTPTSILLATYKWYTEATLIGSSGSPNIDPKKPNSHLSEAQMVFRQLAHVGAKLANLRLGETENKSSPKISSKSPSNNLDINSDDDDPDQLYPLERFQMNNAAQTMRCNPYGARENLLVRSERSLADLTTGRAMDIVKKCIDSVGTSTSQFGDQVLFSNTTSRNKRLRQQQSDAKKKMGQNVEDNAPVIEETEENATVVPISSNSCVDLSEPALIHVWRSAHDGQRFQLSLQTITDGLTQHLLSLGLFVSVISVAVRYQGRFVTVTWIPPLASAAPIVSSLVTPNASPIAKAVIQLLHSRAGVTNPNSLQAYAGKDGRYYLLPTTVGAFLPDNLVGQKNGKSVAENSSPAVGNEDGQIVKTKSGLRKGSRRPPRPELFLRDDVVVVPATTSQDGTASPLSAGSPTTNEPVGGTQSSGEFNNGSANPQKSETGGSGSPKASPKKKSATAADGAPTIAPDMVGPAAAIKRLVAITKDPKFSLNSHPSIDSVGEALHSTGVNLHNMRAIIMDDSAWDTVFAELVAAVAKHKKDIPIKKLKPKLRERFDISRDVVKNLLYVHILGRSVKSLIESSMNAAVCLTRRTPEGSSTEPQQTLVAKIVSANLIVDPFLADFAEGHVATSMQITEQENVHGALDEIMDSKFNIPPGEIVISKVDINIRSAAVDLACRKLNLIFDKDAKRAMSFDNLPRIIGVTSANPPLQVKKAEKFEERIGTVKARVYKGIQATEITEKFLLTQTATVTLGIVARMMLSSLEALHASQDTTESLAAAQKQLEAERAEIHKVLKKIISIGINIDTGRRDAVVMSIPFLVSIYGTCVAVQYTAGITAILTAVIHRLDKIYVTTSLSSSYSPTGFPTPKHEAVDPPSAALGEEEQMLAMLTYADPNEFAQHVPPADRAVVAACFTELSTGFTVALAPLDNKTSQAPRDTAPPTSAKREMASALVQRIIALLVSALPSSANDQVKIPADEGELSTRTDLGIKRTNSTASVSVLSARRTRPGTASIRFLSPAIPSVIHFSSLEIAIKIASDLNKVSGNVQQQPLHILSPETIITLQNLVRDAPHISKKQREFLIIQLLQTSTLELIASPLEQVIQFFATKCTDLCSTVDAVVAAMKEANGKQEGGLTENMLALLDPMVAIQQLTPLQRNYIVLAATYLPKPDLDKVMTAAKKDAVPGAPEDEDEKIFSSNGTFLFQWQDVEGAQAAAERWADKWYNVIRGPNDPLPSAPNPVSQLYPPAPHVTDNKPSVRPQSRAVFEGIEVVDDFGPSLAEALKRKSMVRLVSFSGGARGSAMKGQRSFNLGSMQNPITSSNSHIQGMDAVQSGVFVSEDTLASTGNFNASAIFTSMVNEGSSFNLNESQKDLDALRPMGTFANLNDYIKRFQQEHAKTTSGGSRKASPAPQASNAVQELDTFRALSNYAMTISHTSETTTKETKDVQGQIVTTVTDVQSETTLKQVVVTLWRPHLVADAFEDIEVFYFGNPRGAPEYPTVSVSHPITVTAKSHEMTGEVNSTPSKTAPLAANAEIDDDSAFITAAYADRRAAMNLSLQPNTLQNKHTDYDLSNSDERQTRKQYVHVSDWADFLHQNAREINATQRARADLRTDTKLALDANKIAIATKKFVEDLADMIDLEYKPPPPPPVAEVVPVCEPVDDPKESVEEMVNEEKEAEIVEVVPETLSEPESIVEVRPDTPVEPQPLSSDDEYLILYSAVLLQLHKAYGQKLRVEHRWNSYFTFSTIDIGKYYIPADTKSSAATRGLVPYISEEDLVRQSNSEKSSPTKDKVIAVQKLLTLDDDLFDINEASDHIVASPQRYIRPLLVPEVGASKSSYSDWDESDGLLLSAGSPLVSTTLSTPSGALPLRLPGTFYQHSFLLEFVALERSCEDLDLSEISERMLIEHQFVSNLVTMVEKAERRNLIAAAKTEKALSLIASGNFNNKSTQTADEDEQFLMSIEEKKWQQQREAEQNKDIGLPNPEIAHPAVSDFVLPTMRLTNKETAKKRVGDYRTVNNSTWMAPEFSQSVAVQTMSSMNSNESNPPVLVHAQQTVALQPLSAITIIPAHQSKRSLAPPLPASSAIHTKRSGPHNEPIQEYVPTKLQSEIDSEKAATHRKIREEAPHLFPRSEHDDSLNTVLVGASISGKPIATASTPPPPTAEQEEKQPQLTSESAPVLENSPTVRRQQGILLPPVVLCTKLPPKPDESYFNRSKMNDQSASPAYIPFLATYPPVGRVKTASADKSTHFSPQYNPPVTFSPAPQNSNTNPVQSQVRTAVTLPPVDVRSSPLIPSVTPIEREEISSKGASPSKDALRKSSSLPREATELPPSSRRESNSPSPSVVRPPSKTVDITTSAAVSHSASKPIVEDSDYIPFPLNKIEMHRAITAEQLRLNTLGTQERNLVEVKYPHFHGTVPTTTGALASPGKIRPHSLVGQQTSSPRTLDRPPVTPIFGKVPEPYVRPRLAAEQAIVDSELLAIRKENEERAALTKLENQKRDEDLAEAQRNKEQNAEFSAKKDEVTVSSLADEQVMVARAQKQIELKIENMVDEERVHRHNLYDVESQSRTQHLGIGFQQLSNDIEALRPLEKLRQQQAEEAKRQSGWLLNDLAARSEQVLIEYKIWYLLNINLSISYLLSVRQAEKEARKQLQLGAANSLRRIHNAQLMRDQLEIMQAHTLAVEAERKRTEQQRIDDTTVSQQVGSTLADLRRRREQEELAAKKVVDAAERLKHERREETARKRLTDFEAFCFAVDVVRPINLHISESEQRQNIIKNDYEKNFVIGWYVDFMLPATALFHAEERIRNHIVLEAFDAFQLLVNRPVAQQTSLFSIESAALVSKFGVQHWQAINNSDYVNRLRAKEGGDRGGQERDAFLSNTNLADKRTATVARDDPSAAGLKSPSFDVANTISLHPARYALSKKENNNFNSSKNEAAATSTALTPTAAPYSPLKAPAVPTTKSVAEQEVEERAAIEALHYRKLQDRDLAALKEYQRQQLPSGQKEAMRRRNLERLGHTLE